MDGEGCQKTFGIIINFQLKYSWFEYTNADGNLELLKLIN